MRDNDPISPASTDSARAFAYVAVASIIIALWALLFWVLL